MIANIAKLYEKIQNSLLLFYINDSKDMEDGNKTVLELTEPEPKTKGKEHSLRNIDPLDYDLLALINSSFFGNVSMNELLLIGIGEFIAKYAPKLTDTVSERVEKFSQKTIKTAKHKK